MLKASDFHYSKSTKIACKIWLAVGITTSILNLTRLKCIIFLRKNLETKGHIECKVKWSGGRSCFCLRPFLALSESNRAFCLESWHEWTWSPLVDHKFYSQMLAVITCQQANVIYIFILVSQLQAPFIAGKNPFQCKYTFDEKIGCNSFILMMLKSFMNRVHFSCWQNLEFRK